MLLASLVEPINAKLDDLNAVQEKARSAANGNTAEVMQALTKLSAQVEDFKGEVLSAISAARATPADHEQPTELPTPQPATQRTPPKAPQQAPAAPAPTPSAAPAATAGGPGAPTISVEKSELPQRMADHAARCLTAVMDEVGVGSPGGVCKAFKVLADREFGGRWQCVMYEKGHGGFFLSHAPGQWADFSVRGAEGRTWRVVLFRAT